MLTRPPFVHLLSSCHAIDGLSLEKAREGSSLDPSVHTRLHSRWIFGDSDSDSGFQNQLRFQLWAEVTTLTDLIRKKIA